MKRDLATCDAVLNPDGPELVIELQTLQQIFGCTTQKKG